MRNGILVRAWGKLIRSQGCKGLRGMRGCVGAFFSISSAFDSGGCHIPLCFSAVYNTIFFISNNNNNN